MLKVTVVLFAVGYNPFNPLMKGQVNFHFPMVGKMIAICKEVKVLAHYACLGELKGNGFATKKGDRNAAFFLYNKGIIASSERNNKTCLIASESRHDINEVNIPF